ncbi:MAG: hypothetical protein AABY22_32550 [Nanoarchaeota archaeon]
MSTHKNEEQGKEILRKYHLWMQEKDKYPIKRKSAFSGFERWMMNEYNSKNGKTQLTDKTGGWHVGEQPYDEIIK